MVSNDLDCVPSTFKIMAPMLEGFHNRKKFPIMGTIVPFSPGEFPGPERHRMPVLFGAITGLVLLRNGPCNRKFRRIRFNSNLLGGVEMDQDRCRSERVL